MYRTGHRRDEWRIPAHRQARRMAGVAVLGSLVFAAVTVTDGSFDWQRYSSIVGFFVLACAGSWGISALVSVVFQTSRRLGRGRAAPRSAGPRGLPHSKPISFPAGRTGPWRVSRVSLMIVAAFSVGFGGFLLFDSLDGRRRFRPRSKARSRWRGRAAARPGSANRSDGIVTARGGYSLCSAIIRRSCVVDGDTIWHARTKIRIADIDTPEISSPKCSSEAALGHRAKERLLELLNMGPFDIVHPGGRDEDIYGRKLRVLVRDGRSLGMILVNEGLARRWTGSRRSWCA